MQVKCDTIRHIHLIVFVCDNVMLANNVSIYICGYIKIYYVIIIYNIDKYIGLIIRSVIFKSFQCNIVKKIL